MQKTKLNHIFCGLEEAHTDPGDYIKREVDAGYSVACWEGWNDNRRRKGTEKGKFCHTIWTLLPCPSPASGTLHILCSPVHTCPCMHNSTPNANPKQFPTDSYNTQTRWFYKNLQSNFNSKTLFWFSWQSILEANSPFVSPAVQLNLLDATGGDRAEWNLGLRIHILLCNKIVIFPSYSLYLQTLGELQELFSTCTLQKHGETKVVWAGFNVWKIWVLVLQ